MTKTSIRRLVLAACLSAFALAVTACNTVEGLGKDLQESSENTRKAFD